MKNVHNDLFVSTLKNKQNAIDFLEESLPEDLLAALDLADIGYDDTAYVLAQYKELFSDLVLIVKARETKILVNVYILLEHKSSQPDGCDLFFQLLSYIYAMYGEDRKNNQPFRQIIPLVFYHGCQKWYIPETFRKVINPLEIFAKYTLDFEYILYDVSNFNSDNDRKFQKNVMLYSSLTAMKYAFEQGDLTHIRQLLQRLNDYGLLRDVIKIEMLLVYVSQTHKEHKQEIIEIINEIDKEGGLKMLTFAEYFTEQGIEKGIEKGAYLEKMDTAKKMLFKNYSLKEIIDLTGLSETDILKLQKSV